MTIGSLDDDDDDVVILLYATGELCTSWMGICCLDQTPDSSLKLSLNKKCCCSLHLTHDCFASPLPIPFGSSTLDTTQHVSSIIIPTP